MASKAFLSWSTLDPRMEQLAQIFRNWFSSLYDGDIVFFFSREISPGEASITSIYRGLNEADFGFILLSQRTARSPWVIYESGCLNPSLRAGKVFPLLFDLSPKELRAICPPLADFQAVSLRDPDDMRRLVEVVADLINLDAAATIAVRERYRATLPVLKQAIETAVDSRKLLPDRFRGTVPYNDTIGGSHNFQMPTIFRNFNAELFLVGINLNFLLNLPNNSDNFDALLDALLDDPKKSVRILISDLWDKNMFYVYDKISFGTAAVEFEGLDETFTHRDSVYYVDRYIRDHAGTDGYGRLRRQLTIKKIPLISETFWFVDPDDSTLTGDMMFALITAATGRERPVYYVSQVENPVLFSKYYDVCRAGFDFTSDILWPPL